jgi:hypothetical protein
MTNLLIKDSKAYPTETIRVDGMWGNGRLVYVTEDGWCGICLDGETRVDEYPAEHLGLEDTADEAIAALAA